MRHEIKHYCAFVGNSSDLYGSGVCYGQIPPNRLVNSGSDETTPKMPSTVGFSRLELLAPYFSAAPR